MVTAHRVVEIAQAALAVPVAAEVVLPAQVVVVIALKT